MFKYLLKKLLKAYFLISCFSQDAVIFQIDIQIDSKIVQWFKNLFEKNPCRSKFTLGSSQLCQKRNKRFAFPAQQETITKIRMSIKRIMQTVINNTKI